ncbi:helix-turn-helix domain-containing protein [Nocardioides jiangxiensis]|uniref:Helix-turn-helix transcriptional regulator n=1 Tax=Nocardioides jiangxiensis TaxID=3064524 RepID=A0ABT9B1S8_9ACTN|nr:helix-turn-helix transcriptional regulator [Nocardioides sp. WY-20]MDO7868805.1 helix-turn-helix transcriptional regulator [Nocardioides sp. WY-20]
MDPRPGQDSELQRLWAEMESGRMEEAATTAARLLVGTPDRAVRAEVEGVIGLMLLRTGRLAESAARMRVAADLATAPAVKGLCLARAASANFLSGDVDTCHLLAAQARILGERGHDPNVVAEALAAEAAVVHARGDPVTAARLAHRARDAAGREGPGAVSHAVTAIMLSAAWLDADRVADAEKALDDAIEVGRLAGIDLALPWLLGFRAVTRFVAGDWGGAERDCSQLVTLAEATGNLVASPIGWGVAALVAAGRGDSVSARQLVATAGSHRLSAVGSYGEDWLLLGRAVAAASAAEGHRHLVGAWYCSRQRPWFLMWRLIAPTLVRSALRFGDLQLAQDVARVAADGAALAHGVPGAQACADQCAGLVGDDPDRLARAVAAYAVADRPYWKGKALLDLARCWTGRGEASRALPLLREATDIFHDLTATRAAAQAGLLLAHASDAPARRAPAADPLARLTRAERAVAARAGRGMTNPQIAEELCLSTRTVQAHLSSVYTKLAIGSRVQLAALVAAAEGLGG